MAKFGRAPKDPPDPVPPSEDPSPLPSDALVSHPPMVTDPAPAVGNVTSGEAQVVDSDPTPASPPGGSPTQVVASSSVPPSIPSSSAVPYASRFKASLRNLRKMASPTYLEDGTPVVRAPESVLLKASEMWKDHIIAQFHGLLPPASVVYADLNPIWGKYGNITMRKLSDFACLIFIPSVPTRNWVLEVGYWQAGNCGFNVSPWSASASLELPELVSAPTWAVLKNVPPMLYSLDGISVIASAIGEPLHTENSRLDVVNLGSTKVKVEIMLDSSPPVAVIVRDSIGNSAKVDISYPRLPPKCVNCLRFGHLLNRCPSPLMKRKTVKKGPPAVASVALSPTADPNSSLPTNLSPPIVDLVEVKVPNSSRRRARSRRRRSNDAMEKRASSSPLSIASVPSMEIPLPAPIPIEAVEEVKGVSNQKSYLEAVVTFPPGTSSSESFEKELFLEEKKKELEEKSIGVSGVAFKAPVPDSEEHIAHLTRSGRNKYRKDLRKAGLEAVSPCLDKNLSCALVQGHAVNMEPNL